MKLHKRIQTHSIDIQRLPRNLAAANSYLMRSSKVKD